jgi:hypothetical protein
MKNLILAAILMLPTIVSAGNEENCVSAANLAGTVVDLRESHIPKNLVITAVAEADGISHAVLPDMIDFIETVYDLGLPKKATMNIVYAACINP